MAHSRETGVSWKPELPTAAQHPTRGGAAPRQEGGMTSVLFTKDGLFHKDPQKGPARGRFRRPAA
jgi:hypothetical protein